MNDQPTYTPEEQALIDRFRQLDRAIAATLMELADNGLTPEEEALLLKREQELDALFERLPFSSRRAVALGTKDLEYLA